MERESCACLQAELNISDDEIQQWVSDVQQWAAGNKYILKDRFNSSNAITFFDL